jgi:YhgE/Pip-like protein
VSSGSQASSGDGRGAASAFPVRAGQVLKSRKLWIYPIILGLVLMALITTFYIGSVVDPISHLRGLPVAVVNQDRTVSAGGRQLNFGQDVERGLSGSTAVTSRLDLTDTTLSAAEQAMNRGAVYAVVDIPAGFSASLLTLAGAGASSSASATGAAGASAAIEILTNQRAGPPSARLPARSDSSSRPPCPLRATAH